MAEKDARGGKPWLLWLATALLVIWFLLQGLIKVTAMETMVESWETWSYPPWTMYLVGLGELLGAVLLLVPRTSFIGAIALLFIMPGAAITHILAAEWGSIAIPGVTGLILAFVAWEHQPARLESWLAGRRGRGWSG